MTPVCSQARVEFLYTTVVVPRGEEWRIMLNKQFRRLWIPTDDHCIIWWVGTVYTLHTMNTRHTRSNSSPQERLRPPPVAASHYWDAPGISPPSPHAATLMPFDKRSVATLRVERKCWVGSTPHRGKGEKGSGCFWGEKVTAMLMLVCHGRVGEEKKSQNRKEREWV